MFPFLALILLAGVSNVLAAPVTSDSLQFRLIDCLEGEDEGLSQHILEISNVNETCIRVNESSADGHRVYLYIAPASETGVQIHINTKNCSTALPNIHLSLCDDLPIDLNDTDRFSVFPYHNLTHNETQFDAADNTSMEVSSDWPQTFFETPAGTADENELDYDKQNADDEPISSDLSKDEQVDDDE